MTKHKITNTKLNADDIKVEINYCDNEGCTEEEVEGLLARILREVCLK